VSDLTRVLERQLAAWQLTESPEGQAALDIADRLTETEDLRPAAAAMLHAQLRALLVDLRKLASPEAANDDVADLQDEFGKLRVVP
jgi:hypothetical protein